MNVSKMLAESPVQIKASGRMDDTDFKGGTLVYTLRCKGG